MTALQKLWFNKQKGIIRNLFRKPSSAIFTVFIVLFYGVSFVSTLFFKDTIANTANFDVQNTIMIILGFTALMMMFTLLSSRKALFYDNDAFYLFSGPFSKKQQMKYLMANIALFSVLYGLLSLFLGIMSFSNIKFAPLMLGITFLVVFMINFCFMLLIDYLYIIQICYSKFKNISKIVGGLFVVAIAIPFVIQIIQNSMDFNEAFKYFIMSEMFYFVPIFGWGKLAMVSFIEQNYIFTALGLLLLAIISLIIYFLFTNFKGNYQEKALSDAVEFSEYRKRIKAGDNSTSTKVKKKNLKNSKFLKGAWALLSRTILELKKTHQLVSFQDIIIIVAYVAIGAFSGSFGMVVYMLVLYLFVSPQNQGLKKEFENYMIYLIPDSPLKKLIAIILPVIVKTGVSSILAVVISGIILKENIYNIIFYAITFLGFAFLTTSSTVLALKIFKSRSNQVLEGLLRMLIIAICFIPSVVVIVVMILPTMKAGINIMNLITYVPLVMNFLISFLILFICKNMLNGKELISD
ncbi:putative ABC exporter domain-containing protein [Miniphocaeibacter massiliensis]|uniref:putative ABC exporter domain-containing protein n=1 Tax=Miniphocaeibacter massiliensis TaxID=2041841 RepID=UPI000C1BB520|nr:putative ABC exporter domain-containing protein [Miniphocaeibacter massiliensis]